jgi:aminoglycoside phosphotransferase (APT) family kinase protein
MTLDDPLSGFGAEQVAALATPAVLRPWFAENVPGAQDAPVVVRYMAGGQSNKVFEVRQGERRWVLRRPSERALERADEGMRREYRLLRALDGTDVPHPAPAALCEDPSVIGAVFYVMEYLDGFVPVDPLPSPFDADADERRALVWCVIDALAALHAVDWRAAGLEGFGRPEGFLARQVVRWRSQLDHYRTRELPGIEVVERWLQTNIPPEQEPAIMHGDYHLGNIVAAHETPAHLKGIVDWENATIGDPLLDVGYLLSAWPDPSRPETMNSRLALHAGVPTRSEMLERYARTSGRDLASIAFYDVLSQYKLACMLEGIYARQRDTPYHDTSTIAAYVVTLIDRARATIVDAR